MAYFRNDISELQQTASVGVGSFAQQNIGDATVDGIVSNANPGMALLRPRTWLASVKFKL